MAGNENNLLTTAALGEVSLETQAIQSRQTDVEHEAGSTGMLRALQELRCASKSLDGVIP
jgi:hypothetical protein